MTAGTSVSSILFLVKLKIHTRLWTTLSQYWWSSIDWNFLL